MNLPTVALSIQQPWAWLIVNGHKDIENRTWPTHRRGPVLIHTGLKMDIEARRDMLDMIHPANGGHIDPLLLEAFHRAGQLPLGGIVGVAEIVDCVTASDSPWFVGEYGFVIKNARPLPFMPLRGQLGFFPAEYSVPA